MVLMGEACSDSVDCVQVRLMIALTLIDSSGESWKGYLTCKKKHNGQQLPCQHATAHDQRGLVGATRTVQQVQYLLAYKSTTTYKQRT